MRITSMDCNTQEREAVHLYAASAKRSAGGVGKPPSFPSIDVSFSGVRSGHGAYSKLRSDMCQVAAENIEVEWQRAAFAQCCAVFKRAPRRNGVDCGCGAVYSHLQPSTAIHCHPQPRERQPNHNSGISPKVEDPTSCTSSSGARLPPQTPGNLTMTQGTGRRQYRACIRCRGRKTRCDLSVS